VIGTDLLQMYIDEDLRVPVLEKSEGSVAVINSVDSSSAVKKEVISNSNSSINSNSNSNSNASVNTSNNNGSRADVPKTAKPRINVTVKTLK
jgi:hypothetical protein